MLGWEFSGMLRTIRVYKGSHHPQCRFQNRVGGVKDRRGGARCKESVVFLIQVDVIQRFMNAIWRSQYIFGLQSILFQDNVLL